MNCEYGRKRVSTDNGFHICRRQLKIREYTLVPDPSQQSKDYWITSRDTQIRCEEILSNIKFYEAWEQPTYTDPEIFPTGEIEAG